jgi:FdhD protein
VSLTEPISYSRYEGGRWQAVSGPIVREERVRIHVNGREWVALMCSPYQLDLLALGFLASEGVITGPADVRRIVVCPSSRCVEVWLRNGETVLPIQATRTSGCGGGVTFADLRDETRPVQSDLRVRPSQLAHLMRIMQEGQATRGGHTAALADNETVLIVVEDIGRHNTIDKLWGRCLAEGIPTAHRILLSTGRISSEMLGKAARMGVPVVVSRTSPTGLAAALAAAWGITLVGYLRRDSLNVYAGHGRIVDDEEEQINAHAG